MLWHVRSHRSLCRSSGGVKERFKCALRRSVVPCDTPASCFEQLHATLRSASLAYTPSDVDACTMSLRDSTAGAAPNSVTVRMAQHEQVLVLTHELASIEEIMPYHSIRLNPMPCVEMAGRSCALEPPCSRDVSVYFWWKERMSLSSVTSW